MAKDPSFPFYASDWLGSSVIALMSAEQERGYLRLLCHMWNSPDCGLEDNDDVLSKLSLLGESWLKGSCHLVKRCFIQHPDLDGLITNAKLLEIRKEREAWRIKCALGGSNSAQSRKSNKKTKGSAKGSSTTLASNDPTKRQLDGNSPSPSSSITSKEVIGATTFVESWNATDGAVPVRKLTDKRTTSLNARLAERDWDWQTALKKFPLPCFSDGDWVPNFDWFVKPDTVHAILEGKYDWSKNSPKPGEPVKQRLMTPEELKNWKP